MTLVFSYFLRPPTVGADIVSEQMQLGHRYYNRLIEIERARQADVADEFSRYPEIECVEAHASALTDEICAQRALVKAARAAKRARVQATADQRERIALLLDVRREVYGLLDEARARLASDEGHQARMAAITAEANAIKKEARAARGASWGTGAEVEKAASAAGSATVKNAWRTATKQPKPPKYRRWTGDGMVAVQLQHGRTAAMLVDDTQLQISMPPEDAWDRRRDPRTRTTVRMRVASNGRKPVWAEWPLLMHRPLPRDAVITWAKVLRRRIAGHDRWDLQFTIETGHLPSAATGMVAIDIGWRLRPDGSLRVGYWYDGYFEGEVCAPATVPRGLRLVDDLRSIRDMLFVDARDALVRWLEGRTVPEWLSERTETLHLWQSQARLAALALAWREARWDGDSDGYDPLETWRHKDKHLWTWQTHQRARILAQRRDGYRVAAAELASRYRTVIFEKLDLRTFQAHHAVEDEDPEIRAQRLQQREAAPSEFRDAVMKAVARRGGVVIYVPAKHTTSTCSSCGKPVDAIHPEALLRVCAHCGELADQDAAAARNLARLGERVCCAAGGGANALQSVTVLDYGRGIKTVDGVEKPIQKPPKFAKRHKKNAPDGDGGNGGDGGVGGVA